MRLTIVILGLSITSSWGNGHATTYRSLIKALAARGHRVHFFERETLWYAANRDLPRPPYCDTRLYDAVAQLRDYRSLLQSADVVILGSFVPEAPALLELLEAETDTCLAFYDIDTPVTLGAVADGRCDYLHADMIPRFDLYLSFTGGPVLGELEGRWGARRARPFYCSVDPELYRPHTPAREYDLGYLGTYSPDRQPALEELLLNPARQKPQASFCVAGAQYPDTGHWPANVHRCEHLAPDRHPAFYNSQCFTLSLTRRAMRQVGYAPSVRLFEAAACGCPVISDPWPGLAAFFEPGEEILVAEHADEVFNYLHLDDAARRDVGERMRARVLSAHTAAHRAEELECYWREAAALTDSLAGN